MAGTIKYHAFIGLDKIDGVLNLKKLLSNPLSSRSDYLSQIATDLVECFQYAPFSIENIYYEYFYLKQIRFLLHENMLIIFEDDVPNEIEFPNDFYYISGYYKFPDEWLDISQNLNLNLNLTKRYISPDMFIIYMSYLSEDQLKKALANMAKNASNGPNQFGNNLPPNPNQINELDQNLNLNQAQQNQVQQQNPNQTQLSSEQIMNGLVNLNNSQNNLTNQVAKLNYLQDLQFMSENNTNLADQFKISNQNLEQDKLLVIQQSFWNGLIRNKSSYCSKCCGLMHPNPNITCPRRCHTCFGPHDTKDCLKYNCCKWCGNIMGPHACSFNPNGIKFLTIKCPLCNIKGHTANECKSIFYAIGTLIRAIKRKRRFRKLKKIKRRRKFKKK